MYIYRYILSYMYILSYISCIYYIYYHILYIYAYTCIYIYISYIYIYLSISKNFRNFKNIYIYSKLRKVFTDRRIFSNICPVLFPVSFIACKFHVIKEANSNNFDSGNSKVYSILDLILEGKLENPRGRLKPSIIS